MTASRLPLYLSIAAAVTGVVLLILTGILGWVVIPNIIDNKVRDETRIEEGNDVWDKWENIPVPIYQSYYFFSCTNLEEYDDVVGGNLSAIVPRFEEVGPFVFKEYRNKFDIKDGPDDTIFYKQNVTYVFDAEQSYPLTLNTTVNILNVPLITVLTLQDIHKQTYPFSPAVLGSLQSSRQSLFMEDVPVGEVLFTGYDVVKAGKPIYKNVEDIARILGVPLPDEIKGGVFAFFRDKNNTDDGEWQVYRGRDHSSLFSVIRKMNSNYHKGGPDEEGRFDLNNWWEGDCGMINGTDGTMFPPFVTKERRLEIFVPELCRSIYMKYDSEMSYSDIPGYRFKLPTEIFEAPGEESCFCPPVAEPLERDCGVRGVWKLFRCKASVPMVVSKPHFLDGDEGLVSSGRMMGLSPVREKHDSYIDVEPHTGFPLRLHVRVQIGAELQPYHYLSHIPPYNTIPHAYYPIMWVDKGAELDEPLIDEIKDKLMKPLNAVKIAKWSLIGVGAALVLGGGLLVLKFR